MSAGKVPVRKHASSHPKIARPLSGVKMPKKLAGKFVHYFVPHKRNGYKPLFLRIETVGATAALILVLFIGASAVDQILITSNSPEVAAVVASTLVDLANSDRTQNGLPALTVSPLLQEAAQLKANDEAAKGYFAHVSPAGHDPWYWFAQAGYDFTYAGENLAVYFSDSTAVNTAWMNSPEHRANILSDNFTEIGIATAQGIYQGQETVFVVQEFGAPANVAAAPAPVPAPTSSVPQTAPIAAATSAPSVASAAPVTLAAGESPTVKGASTGTQTQTVPTVSVTPGAQTHAPVLQVLQETPTFIAVKYIGAPPPHFPENTAGTTPAEPAANAATAVLWNLVTSPQSDLSFAYGIIAAIITLALLLEIVVEFRRQHPHRIAMGLSLICLMLILVYAGHVLLIGQLAIA